MDEVPEVLERRHVDDLTVPADRDRVALNWCPKSAGPILDSRVAPDVRCDRALTAAWSWSTSRSGVVDGGWTRWITPRLNAWIEPVAEPMAPATPSESAIAAVDGADQGNPRRGRAPGRPRRLESGPRAAERARRAPAGALPEAGARARCRDRVAVSGTSLSPLPESAPNPYSGSGASRHGAELGPVRIQDRARARARRCCGTRGDDGDVVPGSPVARILRRRPPQRGQAALSLAREYAGSPPAP